MSLYRWFCIVYPLLHRLIRKKICANLPGSKTPFDSEQYMKRWLFVCLGPKEIFRMVYLTWFQLNAYLLPFLSNHRWGCPTQTTLTWSQVWVLGSPTLWRCTRSSAASRANRTALRPRRVWKRPVSPIQLNHYTCDTIPVNRVVTVQDREKEDEHAQLKP